MTQKPIDDQEIAAEVARRKTSRRQAQPSFVIQSRIPTTLFDALEEISIRRTVQARKKISKNQVVTEFLRAGLDAEATGKKVYRDPYPGPSLLQSRVPLDINNGLDSAVAARCLKLGEFYSKNRLIIEYLEDGVEAETEKK